MPAASSGRSATTRSTPMQDKDDDALIGVKSTARLFGDARAGAGSRRSTPPAIGLIGMAAFSRPDFAGLSRSCCWRRARRWPGRWCAAGEPARFCLRLFRANRDTGLSDRSRSGHGVLYALKTGPPTPPWRKHVRRCRSVPSRFVFYALWAIVLVLMVGGDRVLQVLEGDAKATSFTPRRAARLGFLLAHQPRPYEHGREPADLRGHRAVGLGGRARDH
jgi:hypothetical protein